MIIVEGADNVGKSTLIKQLLELDPGLRVLHRDRFKPNQEETIATSYLRALIPADGDRVAHARGLADRFFASECIYGDLFRSGCRMTDGEHQAVRLMLNSYNALIVHCDPPDAAITKSWAEREQLYDHNPLLIANAYRERLASCFPGREIINYDYTSSTASHLIAHIIRKHNRKLSERERELTWWSANPWGVGQLRRPRLILVGEAPSPRAKTPVPFSNGPAGDFLAWAISSAHDEIHWITEDTYITNAQKGTDRDAAILREEFAFLVNPYTTIIPLGRVAEDMVRYVEPQLGVKPLAIMPIPIPHPQFWRRFHYPRRDEYVAKLVEALHLSQCLGGNK
jgi:hypothetical protein